MKERKICFSLLFLVALSWLMGGCVKKSSEEIQFDNSEPLALAPDITWAVVLDPYAGYRKTASWNSEVASYCRKGEIFQVLGETEAKDGGNWYEFKNGWLPELSVTVYNNRFRAETAARRLKK
jgi:hypothetical protein